MWTCSYSRSYCHECQKRKYLIIKVLEARGIEPLSCQLLSEGVRSRSPLSCEDNSALLQTTPDGLR